MRRVIVHRVSKLEVVLELKNVSMQFSTKVVLKNIDLQIRQGESFVLIGPSGHGKTLLLKILAGLQTVSSGEATVFGKNWQSLRGAERLSVLKRLGMLFQKNALFDSLCCSENIAFPLKETTAKSGEEIEKIADHFLTEVGLSHVKKLYPDEISGGMQKRLGIARALALNPEIIFYDDPTAGLDPITSRKIIQMILGLKKELHSTAITVTNDMNRAFQMADRIGFVVDQQLIITGTQEETKRHSDPRVQQFIHGSAEGPLTALG